MSWREHRELKGLKKDDVAESQEGRGLWYLLRRGMDGDRQSGLGGNVKERLVSRAVYDKTSEKWWWL